MLNYFHTTTDFCWLLTKIRQIWNQVCNRFTKLLILIMINLFVYAVASAQLSHSTIDKNNLSFKKGSLSEKLVILDNFYKDLYPDQLMLVDISDKTLVLLENGKQVFKCKVYTGRNGIGNELGSNKTPLGDFEITKHPWHRYGCMFRLSGYQGHVRGILIHKWYGDKRGTSGCICPAYSDMQKLFKMVRVDVKLRIRA